MSVGGESFSNLAQILSKNLITILFLHIFHWDENTVDKKESI